ncbi:MAG: hypothetical protein QOJ08_1903, partial [Ilumatobacteraceae bacterium]
MDDRTIRNLFERTDDDESDAFVAGLRERLEQMLTESPTKPSSGSLSGASSTRALESRERPIEIRPDPGPNYRGRRVRFMTAAALFTVAVSAAVAIAATRSEQHRISPAAEVPTSGTGPISTGASVTTAPNPGPYTQNFNIDITTASNFSVRFNGAAALRNGVESSDTAQIRIGEADVFVFPTFSGTLTNTSARAAELQLTLELFVAPGIVVECIVNDVGCESSINRRASAIVVQAGQTAEIATAADPVRLGSSRAGVA